jgi:hypothetical protein
MAMWDFYKKNGTTFLFSVPDVCEVSTMGKISKTFKFGLESSIDYNNLLALCANVESYFVNRTPMKGAILFVDNSPSQGNTIKIVDPHGINTGYGIIESFTPNILPGCGNLVRTFELKMMWIGASLGTEISSGVYKVILT